MKNGISGFVKKLTAFALAAATLCSGAMIFSSDGNAGNVPLVSAEELASSKYALDMDKTDYVSSSAGLKNPYIVGVDGEKYENEVKYPVNKNAVTVEMQKPEYAFQDSTRALQSAISEAVAKQKISGGEVVIKLPAGKLYFYQGGYSPELGGYGDYTFEDGVNGRYALFMNGLKNITLTGTTDADGKNTECVLLGENGFYFARVIGCENVLFTNFSVDYGELPYYFGEVTERVDKNTLIIRTWNDYPVDDTNIACYIEYDKDTNNIREAGNHLYNASGLTDIEKVTVKGEGGHLVEIKFAQNMNATPIGTKVALSTMKTDGNIFVVTKSKNVYFESINLYCGGGSGILGRSNENLYFNRFNAKLKEGTDRLLTIAGDFIHVEDTMGEVSITNCLIENTQDDGVNICGHYMYPYSVSKNDNSAVLMYRSNISQTYECKTGDVLAMMDRTSMLVNGYYQVEKTEYSDGRYIVYFKKGGEAYLPSGEKVTLEADVSKIGTQDDCVFSNLTRSPKVTVENCIIRNKRNRGLLIQSRNVSVKNCDFVNVVHTALMLLGEMASFCESTLPKDVIIENCKFVGCDTQDIQISSWNKNNDSGNAGAIENVTIKNNLFAYQQNSYSLYFAGVKNADIEGNWFYKPQTGTKKTGYDTAAIAMRNVDGVNFDKNLLTKFLPSRDGIFVWEGVSVDSFDWGDNEGFDRKDVFGEAKTVELANIGTAVKIDGSLADWNKIDATEIPINNVTNVHIQKMDFSAVPAGDFSATVKAYVKMSDGNGFAADDGIYFCFDVVDDVVRFERSAWWTGDCMEFYLSSNLTAYDEIGVIRNDTNTETIQLAVKGDADGNCQSNVYPGRTSDGILEKLVLSTAASNAEYVSGDIKVAFALTRKGYRGEVFLPFSLFKVCGENLKKGEAVAMAFCFVDSSEGAGLEGWDESMTFSNIPHPTCTANKVPATMVRFALGGKN